MTDLPWKWTAHKAVEELKSGRISPLELIDSCEKRIADTNNLVNALPTLCFDRARKFAKIYEYRPSNISSPVSSS